MLDDKRGESDELAFILLAFADCIVEEKVSITWLSKLPQVDSPAHYFDVLHRRIVHDAFIPHKPVAILRNNIISQR